MDYSWQSGEKNRTAVEKWNAMKGASDEEVLAMVGAVRSVHAAREAEEAAAREAAREAAKASSERRRRHRVSFASAPIVIDEAAAWEELAVYEAGAGEGEGRI